MNSKKTTARIAGLLFLILVVLGIFAEFFVRQKIIVPDNALATAQNILASEGLFRLGIVSDLLMTTVYFFFPLVLYKLFNEVNKGHARLMVLCVMISVAILCVNMFNQVAALVLLSGADYLNGFDSEQLQGMVMFFLNMHTNGYMIAQIFYGLYLFPLGYLVYKSGFLPKIIGVFLMLGCIGDFMDFGRYFLSPNSESIILLNATLPANIGEFSLCLWLLIMGIKVKQPAPIDGT